MTPSVTPDLTRTQAQAEQKTICISVSVTGNGKPAKLRMYLLSITTLADRTIHSKVILNVQREVGAGTLAPFQVLCSAVCCGAFQTHGRKLAGHREKPTGKTLTL